jgi:hypothetical protein
VAREQVPECGQPWVGGVPGEVIGPSGRRCLQADSAARRLGVTGRTVRTWATQGKHGLELDPSAGKKQVHYVLADTVDAAARALGRPTNEARIPDRDESAWAELVERQGHDLELARAEARRLAAVNKSLDLDLKAARGEVARLGGQVRRISQALALTAAALEAELTEVHDS